MRPTRGPVPAAGAFGIDPTAGTRRRRGARPQRCEALRGRRIGARAGQRWSIGSTSRRVAPTNSWRGRPIFCSG
ncbi:MAG TPA: hypothetical protein VM491_06945, partial [Burkholderiaceae bacterium]|nr:hypothetical protein [Burkholderiaceae bacterium]